MKTKAKGIAGSLTRKIGPLPVWAWAAIVFAGIFYYRNKLSAAATGTGTGSVGPTPADPQAGTVLEPGESYYDPNTGALTTAPGGGNGGGGNGGDPSAAIDSLANAIADAIAAANADQTTGGGGSGDGSGGGGGRGKGGKGKGSADRTKPKKLIGKGAVRAQSGPHKPHPKKGYKIRGLGGGAWEYVPVSHSNKRDNKGKNNHHKNGKTTTKTAPQKNPKNKARSGATVRNKVGGRIKTARTRGAGWGKAAKSTKPTGKWATPSGWRSSKPQATQMRATGHSSMRHTMVRAPVVRQRPVANASPHTTPHGNTRPSARPSAPPRRTASRTRSTRRR